MACCARDERARVRGPEVGAGGLVDGDGEGRCQSGVTRKLLRRRPTSSVSAIPWTAVASSRAGLPGGRVAARVGLAMMPWVEALAADRARLEAVNALQHESWPLGGPRRSPPVAPPQGDPSAPSTPSSLS